MKPIPLAQQRINLIDEYDRGLVHTRDSKQGAHHFLALSIPLGRQCGRRDTEEGGPTLGRYTFANESFACAWRAEEQDTCGKEQKYTSYISYT